jgi:hypothetical protein
MGAIIKYLHHDTIVSVDADNKGKHREHCLCWQSCALFHPNEDANCPIAKEVFLTCTKYGIVTPVWECPDFKPAA